MTRYRPIFNRRRSLTDVKFEARILGGELPIGLGVIGIAVVLPRGDLLDEGLFVGSAAIEALGR